MAFGTEVRRRGQRIPSPLRRADFINTGDDDIAARVEKINRYSTGLVADKLRRGQRFSGPMMLLYPPIFFVRQYIFKRYCLSGWPASSPAWLARSMCS